jgi:hypothetical protein
MPLTLPKVMVVGVTPVSEAVLPAVPVQSAASAAGEKLKPAEFAVTDAAGALVAPPAPAAAVPAPVRTPEPEPSDPPPLPPSASAGVVQVVVVVVDEDEEVVDDLDLLVVVVVVLDPDFAAAAAAAVVVVDVHGTVVAVPAACATPFVPVPPPDAPRYGLTRAPHEVATRASTRSPSSPADLLFTSAPRTQAPT